MSYDLVILTPSTGLTPASIADGFERMDNGEAYPFGEPTKELEACACEIWEHYPPLHALTDDEIEKSIWSCDHDTIDGFIHMAMRWSVEPSTLNTITKIARKHGLVVFNPQLNDFPDTYTPDSMSIKDIKSVKDQIEQQLGGFLKNLVKKDKQ